MCDSHHTRVAGELSDTGGATPGKYERNFRSSCLSCRRSSTVVVENCAQRTLACLSCRTRNARPTRRSMLRVRAALYEALLHTETTLSDILVHIKVISLQCAARSPARSRVCVRWLSSTEEHRGSSPPPCQTHANFSTVTPRINRRASRQRSHFVSECLDPEPFSGQRLLKENQRERVARRLQRRCEPKPTERLAARSK